MVPVTVPVSHIHRTFFGKLSSSLSRRRWYPRSDPLQYPKTGTENQYRQLDYRGMLPLVVALVVAAVLVLALEVHLVLALAEEVHLVLALAEEDHHQRYNPVGPIGTTVPYQQEDSGWYIQNL